MEKVPFGSENLGKLQGILCAAAAEPGLAASNDSGRVWPFL